MLKHQIHFNSVAQDIAPTEETLFRDLEVALESLDQALCWNQSLHEGDSTVFPSVGMEAVAEVSPDHFGEALKRVKDIIEKAIVWVKEAFDRLVRWLDVRSKAVQHRIAVVRDKVKEKVTGRLEVQSHEPLQSLAIDRMLYRSPNNYFTTEHLREMVRTLDKMVDLTVKNDGNAGPGTQMLLLRYDRHSYLWLIGSEDGSGAVPTGGGYPAYAVINSYLDDTPTPLEAFENMVRNQPQEKTWSMTQQEVLSRLDAMRQGLTRFAQDVISPRRDADQLLRKLATVDEIVSEDQQKHLRAMTRMISRNTGNMTAGYNFQVRIANTAVSVLEEALGQ